MKIENSLLHMIAFFALVAIALLELISGLSKIGIDLFGATILNVLNTIKNIGVVLVIGISAYKFVANKKKAWVIVYLVAVAIFIASTVLMWF